jgi:predicted RNA-binding Zn-ribbon protein involved in translation (DUF1610 family)
MIRVRFYSLVLSLPILVVVVSLVMAFAFDADLRLSLSVLAVGIGVQLVFALIFACPRCGKSPYAIGPSIGPFALAGKPIPDTKCSKCGFDFLAKATECDTSSEMPPPK